MIWSSIFFGCWSKAEPVVERSLELTEPGQEVLEAAMKAVNKISEADNKNYSIVTIVDMTMHSSTKRLWTIDLNTEEVLYNLAVSHGRGSDSDHDGMLDTVGNVRESGKTSVGLYKTAETYSGKHGYSLRLDGLEKGFNDNARKRAIVVHGADYVNDAFLKKHGKSGRSLGCPAVSEAVSAEFIDTIKDGTLYFIYADDSTWLKESVYLQ